MSYMAGEGLAWQGCTLDVQLLPGVPTVAEPCFIASDPLGFRTLDPACGPN